MDIELKARVRTETGKGAARKLRAQHQIPAICYGPQTEPLPLSVPTSLMIKCLREIGDETRLIPMVIEDGDQTTRKQVMIREVQVHPFRRRILHVDFFEVPLDVALEVDVPVELVGECQGVKDGGILNLLRFTLSVRCLPTEIPEKITIDVSSLKVGDAIHIEDLKGKYPFEILGDDQYTVVTVGAPEAEEEVAEAEEEIVETEGEEVTES